MTELLRELFRQKGNAFQPVSQHETA